MEAAMQRATLRAPTCSNTFKVFYIRIRRHSSLDGVSPLSFYETWFNRQSASKQAA
jgi:hypothetical protein